MPRILLFRAESLTDHIATNHQQQAEGYPVVVGFKLCAEMTDAQPAQQWHHRLEEAEQERHTQHTSPQHTTDDGNREAVHGQCNG